MLKRTLVIIKPDAIRRGITGKIVDRLEQKGLQLVASKMTMLNEEVLKDHYSHLVDKPFFGNIVDFMLSAPVILQVWEGVDAVDVVRLLCGVTNSRQAQPGTIRGDFAMSIQKNVVHASENNEIAEEEINRFFDENEIFTYQRVDGVELYTSDEL